MTSFLERRSELVIRAFRFVCGAQAGAQIFFAAIAAQLIFTREVASLPHDDPRRTLAADLVGQMLQRLDASALLVAGLAVALAFFLWRGGKSSFRRALQPLLAGMCALASIFGTTPAIHALSLAGRTNEPAFAIMHGFSGVLLAVEIILFTCAALFADKA